MFHIETTCKKHLFFSPNSWQKSIESISEITAQLISDIISINNEKYFPIISVLFNFILFSNVIGLVFYSFISTSHSKEFKSHKYKTQKFKRVAIPISNGDIRYLGILSRKVVQAAILNVLGPSFKRLSVIIVIRHLSN